MKINNELNNEATAMAQHLCETHNPYRSTAEVQIIQGSTLVVYRAQNGGLYTAKALDEEYKKTAKHDFIRGYNDRIVGYYDKWYRYNHADSGRAYDEGVKYATQQNKCAKEMHIIECI